MTETVVLATLTDLMRGGMLTLLLVAGGFTAREVYIRLSRRR